MNLSVRARVRDAGGYADTSSEAIMPEGSAKDRNNRITVDPVGKFEFVGQGWQMRDTSL
jgi:hypothetical protein